MHSAGALTVPDWLGVAQKAGGTGVLSLGSVRELKRWSLWVLTLGAGCRLG